MRVLHGMRGMNIIGGDVVCPMPTKDDPSKITSINASVIMFEIICLVADWLDKNGRWFNRLPDVTGALRRA